MKTIDKILIIIILTSLTLAFLMYQKTKQTIEENKTLKEAINKPAIKQEPKIKYIKTEIEKPIYRTQEVIKDLSEEERERYSEWIKKLNDELAKLKSEKETKTEIIYEGAFESKPLVPEIENVLKKNKFGIGIWGEIREKENLFGGISFRYNKISCGLGTGNKEKIGGYLSYELIKF